MVKEGYYFGLPPLALGAAALFLHWNIAGAILFFLAAFVFYFFRDPERAISADAGAIVSPADGRVVVVTDEENSGRPGKRISIFLAIWNVHVNRSPAAGTITNLTYRPGQFLAAMRESASTHNEQNIITLATDSGELTFKQIAGLIARRVICWKKSGDRVPAENASAWFASVPAPTSGSLATPSCWSKSATTSKAAPVLSPTGHRA